MLFENSPQHVYLSYAHDDEAFAKQFHEMMEPFGISVSSCRDNETNQEIEEQAESVLTHCSLVVVLIGPKTRDSRWVDLEIALGTAPRTGLPGAGLLGIILPEHVDFAMPYYDPANIPLRLHDRARWEYALVRKWIDRPDVIHSWLQDAERRRRHFRSAPNFSALQALKEFHWDDNADKPRPVLQTLSERD